jgi:hypothetical protein
MYIRIAGQAVDLNPPAPVPVGEGLLMSRGPTGSRWGPDALGSDGGLPAMKTPTYGTTSGTSFTPFAQAADFAWFWGVNHHPKESAAWSTNHAAAIDAIQELGFFHVRAVVAYMANTNFVQAQQTRSQQWYIACMNANLNRSLDSGGPAGTGEAPIWNNFNGPDERGWYQSTEYANAHGDGAKYAYWVNTDDALGESIFRPMDGPPGTIAVSAFSWGGSILGRDGTTTDTEEMGWEGVCALFGPNEPGHRNPAAGARYSVANFGVHWLAREMKAYRDANGDTEILQGESYINFNTGRITAGPALLKQAPVIPVCHITPESKWSANSAPDPVGDFTDRQSGEFMDWHQYWNGHTPLWDHPWGAPDTTYPGGFGSQTTNFGQKAGAQGTRASINGSLNPETPGVKFQRSIPMTVTEGGHVQKFDGRFAFPCPEDITGEYLIKQGVVHYLQGVKRFYVYALNDEGWTPSGGQLGWGLVNTDYSRKPSFYALKNLMGLMGFSQGPDEGIQPIHIPHTYTPVGSATLGGLVGQWTARKPPGTGDDFQRDMLLKLVLQTGDDEFLLIATRLFQMWARTSFNEAGRPQDPAVYNQYRRTVASEGGLGLASFHLPSGWTWTAEVAEPAKSSLTPSVSSPVTGLTSIDGCTYANMNNGQTYSSINDGTQMQITKVGNRLDVPYGGLTRVIKLVRS